MENQVWLMKDSEGFVIGVYVSADAAFKSVDYRSGYNVSGWVVQQMPYVAPPEPHCPSCDATTYLMRERSPYGSTRCINNHLHLNSEWC